MSRKSVVLAAAAVALVTSGGNAFAVATAEEAKALGNTLTPWGAEKAGNKEGTIPAYTGEPIKKPANYNPATPGHHPDPFGGEKPLFTISAQNYSQYAGKLDGMAEMFKKFPNYRMDVSKKLQTIRRKSKSSYKRRRRIDSVFFNLYLIV